MNLIPMEVSAVKREKNLFFSDRFLGSGFLLALIDN
jgi:hypothetical protein